MLSLRFLLATALIWRISGDNVGWKGLITENSKEFHDLPLSWESLANVPSWLSGTYVRNGPAQISFGSERRVFTSWIEAFGKLHSFKMDGEEILYSGKMLESPNYLASVENGELVPQLTLNKFRTPEEEWTPWEMLQIAAKVLMQTELDNNNPALWRIGPEKNGVYMAVTDAKVSMRFNISDLSTLGPMYPSLYPFTLTGCAHWMREPGTDNSINFQYKKGITGLPWVEVQRYRPEDTYQTPQVVATFAPSKLSYIHSFSITENYVIFIFYPVVIDYDSFPQSNFHVFEMLKSNWTDTTDIFAVNLRTGEVKGPFSTESTSYSVHHVNAYEKNDAELIVDVAPTPFDNLKDFHRLDNFLNPPCIDDDVHTSGVDQELTRYNIDIVTGEVKIGKFDNVIKSRYVNNFDFPTINENYRGKKYCYIYGWSAFAYSRIALVKKNVCDSTKDKVWYRENDYGSEMHFLPRPAGKEEDDGVVITIVFDGEKEQSYFLVLDAKTMKTVNKAYLPHNVPFSAHGMWFPEARHTIQPFKTYKDEL